MKFRVALSLVASLLCFATPAPAQQVTLTAHVRTTGSKSSEKSASPNVVVWLSPLDSNAQPRPFHGAPLVLAQHNKSFQPHILVVPVGAVVQFPNRDPFFHNVFSLFDGKRFDLGLYEAGSSRNVSFDRPGISYIFCNIHAEMSAVVIALETPYYAISNRKGELVLPDVPIGRYTMHTWYETALPASLNAMTREITVTEQSSTLGLIEVPQQTGVSAHKNKSGMDYEPSTPDSPGYTPH